jgi:membrane peptidoglycan carboxypeptidase
MLAWLAIRCLNADWQNLEIRLLATYEIYRSSLKTNVPEIIVRALVAGEDHRFYQHSGVDFIGILAALRRSIWQRRTYGASTINQQLIRVLTNRYERTLKRKIKEILLASLVTRSIPKSDIPGVYLSVAYFGWTMNGLEQACRRLGIVLPTITLRQAAALVAQIKYPRPMNVSHARSRQINTRTEHLIRLISRGNDSQKLPIGAEPDAAL